MSEITPRNIDKQPLDKLYKRTSDIFNVPAANVKKAFPEERREELSDYIRRHYTALDNTIGPAVFSVIFIAAAAMLNGANNMGSTFTICSGLIASGFSIAALHNAKKLRTIKDQWEKELNASVPSAAPGPNGPEPS
ncbi:MAG: hypothetical protein LRY76_06965 [Alphaproteobacteria bacterium]|nr:hypothetical protein [Alphaproteobacteria bacterium]